MIADYLSEMENDVVGLRALAMHAGVHDDVGQKQALFSRFLGNAAAGALALDARRHQAIARR